MKTIATDTNVVLRYLLNDSSALSQRAKKLFLDAEQGKIKIYLDEVILAEIIWTLTSFHKLPKKEVVASLKVILSQKWLINSRKKCLLEAIDAFAKNNVDYVDCWLFAAAKPLGLKIGSFDKDFNKLDRRILHNFSH